MALTLLEARLDREQAVGCTITRHSKDVINKFAIAAGLWQQIITQLLPSLLLPPGVVNALDEKFRQGVMLKGSLFEEVWQMAQTEVDDEIDDVPSLLPFVHKHLSEVRHTQAAHRKELREAEAQHPTNILTHQEMSQLTADIYLGKITLDANSYRAALQKLSQNLASEKDALAAAQLSHIKSVQAAQNQMQLSDVVFASPATGGLTVPDGIHWLAAAVQEASKNRGRVSGLVHKTDVEMINILSLPTHGMTTKTFLQQVRSSVLMQSDMCGPTLLMYPLIPRSVYKAKRTMTASAAAGASSTAAVGASAECGGDDDSIGSEDDISGEEGQLPDVLTKASTTMTKFERDAALAKDRYDIDSILGQHDLTQVCPKPITLSYKQDTSGARSSDKGLLLIPAPAGNAPASGGGKPHEPFEKSATFRDGVLVDLEPPREFFNVSKKFSMECRRSQAAGWKTENLTSTSRNYVGGKVARGQIGWQTYEALLTDLVKNCSAPNLLVNDFMAGVGEVGVAAVRVKVSEVAKQCGVRVFYWGCDERRVFAEVARANIRTHIGEAFLARELVVPGLDPVKAPPPQTMATGITKVGIEKFLPTPLEQLSLTGDGRLAIPTEQELKDNPPVSLTPQLVSLFENLREEFAASKPAPVPATGGDPKPPPAGDPAPGDDPKPPVPPEQPAGDSILKAGDTVGSRSELHGILHKSGPKSKIHKEVQQNGVLDWGLLLVEVEDKESPYRVLIENRSKTQLKLPAGTFVGRGGPCNLVNEKPEGRKLLHAWLYSRCSEWKRDIATRGNGFWVFQKAPASGGGPDKPRMQTLEEIQSELGAEGFSDVWAHNVTRGARAVRISPVVVQVWWVPKGVNPDMAVEEFGISQLGAWVPSREKQTDTGLECTGLLRPAFEVKLEGLNGKTLTPDLNPASGGNPLCLFLKKALILKAGQMAVL